MSVQINGTNGLTFNDGSSQQTAASGFGFKNRIINGAMMIDQRNAGASVSVGSSSSFFSVDRFYGQGQNTDGVFTLQQLSATPPSGYINYVRATVTTADASIGASQFYDLVQNIEGLNVADLGWGAVGASTVTLSFWVRSSVTGTFGGSLRNFAADRSYPFSYTISSANTWEQKTITVAGDTTGTWLQTNNIGIRVNWSLGDGSSRLGTDGIWAATNYAGVTGQTNLISTLNATWDITGVQLEKGSTATSFDYRPYGTELALCQRYFQNYNGDGSGGKAIMPYGSPPLATELDVYMQLPVPMRASPAMTINALQAYDGLNAASSITSSSVYQNSSSVFGAYFGTTGLTVYRPYMVRTASAGGYLQLSAEL